MSARNANRPARSAPLVDARRPLPLADRHQPRQHDPQRRAADARADWAPPPRSCSGSSTPTCSSSPALLLTAGALGDRFGRRRALTFGLFVFGAGSALSAARHLARDADRDPRADGRRRRVHHALDALDPHQRLPRRRAREGDRHLGRRSRASASRSARSPAAGSSSTPTGAGSSSSTSRSSSPRCARRALPGARVARPRHPAARPARLRPLDRRPRRARVGDHRGARRAAGPTPSMLAGFAARRARARPRSRAGSCARREPMLDVRLFRNPRFSAVERWRSRWPSSPCSG